MQKKENNVPLKHIERLFKTAIILFSIFMVGFLFFLYLFLRPIILEEYCGAQARKKAKSYTQQIVKPPKDLLDAYKNSPQLINKDSLPSPYYVELLRCELRVSKKLYPFLH